MVNQGGDYLEYEKYRTLFNDLRLEAKELGYRVEYTTARIEISLGVKVIRMKYYIRTMENLYCFCHELGHAREKNPNMELYRTNKAYRIYNEILAWVLGYKFVRKYDLPRVAYAKSAIIHVKTYIKRKKRKPIQSMNTR